MVVLWPRASRASYFTHRPLNPTDSYHSYALYNPRFPGLELSYTSLHTIHVANLRALCRVPQTNSSSPYHHSNKAFNSVSNKSTFIVFNPIHISPYQTLLVQARIALKFGVEWLICTLNQVVELLSSWCSDGSILKSLLAII